MSQPFFSVIVPTYGRPGQLTTCLQALAHLHYPREHFEVVVVDDGSATPLDGVIASFHDRLDVTLLRQAHAGPAAARNTGAAQARGEFLAFTDDDCVPASDWLRRLATRFALTPDRLIGGRTRNALPDNPYTVASQVIVDLVYAYYNADPDHARFFASNNLALPVERFRVLGGFDATFTTSEDREFCDRWLYHGYHMTYAPEAVVFHAHALTLRTFCRQHFHYGRGAFRFHRTRAQRNSGRFSQELPFYAHLPRLLCHALARMPRGQAFVLATLLVVWQGANAAGCVWEGVKRTVQLQSYVRRWQGVLRRAAEILREEGVKSLWFKILGETVYRRMVLLERPLDEPIMEITPSVPVEIGLLAETEVDDYLRFRPEADPSDLHRRFAAGQWCFVARYERRIVHACWVATQRAWIHYLNCEIRLASDEVYLYESFTAPGFRGRNIAPARMTQSLRYFRDAGYRRAVSAVMPENKPGLRADEKLYRLFGMLGYVKLGPWRWDFCRVQHSARPPDAAPTAHGPAYWDSVVQPCGDKPHYLDPFLGALKRQAHLALIQRWGGVPATGRVLKTDLFEEAMGPDAFLTDLAGGEGIVIGMDVSAVIARQAQNRDASRQVHYVAVDTRRLPFADDAFALIVSPSTLDHFSDARDLGRSLRELARVLEPNGRLIITLDNRQNLFDPLLRLAIRLRKVPYYIGRSYTVGELRAELEATGFTVQETTAILHNPRLVAVAAVALAKKLRWPLLMALVQRALVAAQRLEKTRWRYYTGSFVAAKAVRKA